MSAAGDPDEPTVILTEEYDPDRREPISLRIVRLVAIADDREPMELDPLGQTIDTDALNVFFDSKSLSDPAVSVDISFRYGGYQIDIDANGTIRLLIEEE